MNRSIIIFPVLMALMVITAGCTSAPSGGNSTSSSAPSSCVYVATNGNNSNSGISKNQPLLTIQNAVDLAASLGYANVYVAEGIYITNRGLNATTNGVLIVSNNLSLSGGWDQGFNSQSGKSVLDGQNVLYHIVRISHTADININGFVITGANAPDNMIEGNGGGILTEWVTNLSIANCIISNNYATNGGGMYMDSSISNTVNCIFFRNTARDESGGIYLRNSGYNIVSGAIYSNAATNCGGVYIFQSGYNTVSAAVYGNKSIWSGGGLYLFLTSSNVISGDVYGNTAVNSYGGGLYLQNSCYNSVSGNIYGNTAGFWGGGICFHSSSNNQVNGFICSNMTPNVGGGICFYKSAYITTTSNISFNYAVVAKGGGIAYINSSYNTNLGVISYNSNWGIVTNTTCVGNSNANVANNLPGNISIN